MGTWVRSGSGWVETHVIGLSLFLVPCSFSTSYKEAFLVVMALGWATHVRSGLGWVETHVMKLAHLLNRLFFQPTPDTLLNR